MRRAPVGGPEARDCNRHRALDEYVTTTHRAPNQLRRRSFRESRSRGSRAAVSSDWCTGDYKKKNQPGGARVRRRSFVDRNLYHNTTQHPQQHNTTACITKEKIVSHPPAFSLSGYWSRPERKASFTRRRPRRRVRRGQTSRRVASVFPTATRAKPRRYRRVSIPACRSRPYANGGTPIRVCVSATASTSRRTSRAEGSVPAGPAHIARRSRGTKCASVNAGGAMSRPLLVRGTPP